jgi:hypothetical protein
MKKRRKKSGTSPSIAKNKRTKTLLRKNKEFEILDSKTRPYYSAKEVTEVGVHALHINHLLFCDASPECALNMT